ncbi:MAG: hypothetical protein ACNA8L_10255 [Luteolibacter sp.]
MAEKFDLKSIRPGDTFPARIIARLTAEETGDPIPVTFAAMQLRTIGTNQIIHEWRTDGDAPNASIVGEGNAVMLHEVSHLLTIQWPIGRLVYDLLVDLPGIERFRLLYGQLSISRDITRETL